jgi:hypothetical protein
MLVAAPLVSVNAGAKVIESPTRNGPQDAPALRAFSRNRGAREAVAAGGPALVMQAGLVGLVAMPFGFDGLFWWLMGIGIDWMIAVT